MSTATGPHLDRRTQLRAIADVYFNGLANGSIAAVPYAENVVFRTPLAPGGSDVPIRGRSALLDFFAGIYAALEQVRVIDYFFNEAGTAICVRADLVLKTKGVLRVADVFRLSADGMVIEQENHYDPRPAGA